MFLKKTKEQLVLAILFPWGFRDIVLNNSLLESMTVT